MIQSRCESLIANAARTPVSESHLDRLITSCLAVLADHGYHHAEIAPQNFRAAGDSLSFELVIDAGPPMAISKWEFLGLVRTDSAWLATALDLPTHVVADAEVIEKSVNRVRSISNLTLAAPPEIVASSGDSTVRVILKLRETPPARFEGALAAGSAEGADQSLLGRFSLGLDGLFRRDRSLDVRYEHPQPSERLTRITYADHLAFSRVMSTRISLEDWRRDDHRQRAGLDLSLFPAPRHRIALLTSANWQKIGALSATIAPARVYEVSLGAAQGEIRRNHVSFQGTMSINRQWPQATGIENSMTRLRLDIEGSHSTHLTASSSIEFAFGSRWWTRGEGLRAGDEWFLGGEVLRGYAARSLAAASGLWSRMSLSKSTRSGLGAAIFGEYAWLSMFDDSYQRPGSVGLAILLESPGRSGRLELAWRDRAALRDGILRLAVVQGW